jgi:hypothetical protein
VCGALAYVIWRAYEAEGETQMGQKINEVIEKMIVELHHFAEQTGRFDHQLARRLLNYLRANYMTSKIDVLGGPILRHDVASGANIEILKKIGLDQGNLCFDHPSRLLPITLRHSP